MKNKKFEMIKLYMRLLVDYQNYGDVLQEDFNDISAKYIAYEYGYKYKDFREIMKFLEDIGLCKIERNEKGKEVIKIINDVIFEYRCLLDRLGYHIKFEKNWRYE